MSQEVEIHLRAYDEASDIITQVGSNLSSTFTDVEGRTQDLVTTTDNATSQMVDDYNQVNDAGQNLGNSQRDIQNSMGDSVMALNNLALSGASLAMSFMMVENRQVAVDRANLMVQRSTEALQKAQDTYNKVVQQYGADSAQAQATQEKLAIAENAHNVAIERADMAQRNLSMSMTMAALTVIPSLVSMITTVSHATEIWEGIQATMNAVMDVNPIFLVVSAVGALVAALALIPGAWDAVVHAFAVAGSALVSFANAIRGAWDDFVGVFTGGNKKAADSIDWLTLKVRDSTAAMSDAQKMDQAVIDQIDKLSVVTPETASAIGKFQDEVVLANDALSASNEILERTATTIGGYKDIEASAGEEIKVLDTRITDLNKAYEESKSALDSQIAALQSSVPALQGQGGATNALTDTQKAALVTIENLTGQEDALKNQLDANVGALENEKSALEEQEAAAKEAATFLADLTTKYDEMKASADTNLAAIKEAFDTAFNAGDFDKALGIVKDFANKYGLSLEDAEKIIDNFKDAQAEVPKSIEEQLIGKAQAGLETFKKCATGKYAGLQTDSTVSVKQLVSDTNDLIAHGLVGQAQDNIRAFCDCSKDKQTQMVSQIDAELTRLQNSYTDHLQAMQETTQLLEWRIAATWGQANTDILTAIKVANGSIQSLADLTKATTQSVDDDVSAMTERMIEQAAALKHSLVGGSIWTEMLTEMESSTEKSVVKITGQFQTLKAESMVGGGRLGVPEALPGAGGEKRQLSLTSKHRLSTSRAAQTGQLLI
jgi:hypothetical protein